MSQVEILSETEERGGWAFEAQVLDDQGRLSRHRLTLSWADYNLWSADGRDEPCKVIEAVLSFLLAHQAAADLRRHFDASMARRWFADADQTIPGLIGR